MNCQIVFTDTAKSDLRDIAFYLADLSKDKNLAIRFVKVLQERAKPLFANLVSLWIHFCN